MAQKEGKGISEISVAIHQYYMDILNCLPSIVYWTDAECRLKGANNKFVGLLGLNDLHDFSGTVHELLNKYAHWPLERIESWQLDDMSVIFSGKAKNGVTEAPIRTEQGQVCHYISTRVPLLDKQKKVTGLVVVLLDASDKPHLEPSIVPPVLKPAILKNKIPRILMVEDNVVAQKVERALLTSLGCEVDLAETGEEALKLFTPGRYDLILMDIGLQDTSGYIVTKKIREQEKETAYRVPIIALTSYQADIVKYDCRDYFMDGVLTKPLTDDQAQQIIQHYVYQQDISVDGLE